MFTLFDKTTIDTHSLNSKSLLLILKLILYMISTKLYPVVEDKLQEETYGYMFTQNLLIIQTFIIKLIA